MPLPGSNDTAHATGWRYVNCPVPPDAALRFISVGRSSRAAVLKRAVGILRPVVRGVGGALRGARGDA